MQFEEKLSEEKRTELIQRCVKLKDEMAIEGESAEKWIRLSNIHLKLGEQTEAIMALQSALELRPGTPAILSKLKQICTEEEFAELELPEKPEPFWRDISGLIKYPFSGSGIYLLIGGTVFVTVTQFIINLPTIFFYVTIMISVFLTGYLSAYFISVMRSSAKDIGNPPDWPDITHIGQNVLRPLLIVSFPGTISFFPALIYLGYWLFRGSGDISVLIGLIAVGALYYPMALIASAISGTVMNSLNFVGVIGSIIKVSKAYFITELVLAFLAGISIAAYFIVGSVTGVLAGTIVAAFALRFVYLYFMMVYARILGLFYRQCQSKIG